MYVKQIRKEKEKSFETFMGLGLFFLVDREEEEEEKRSLAVITFSPHGIAFILQVKKKVIRRRER